MSDVFNALIAETEGDQYKVSIKKIGKFIKKYARVIVAVVAAVVVTWATAGAATAAFGNIIGGALAGAAGGAVSGLVMTGSLKGMLEGAVFGAITGGFAGYLKDAAIAAKASVVSKALTAGKVVSETAIKAIEFATKVKSVLGHALIGGLRAVHNGGKFLTGFLSGGLGKLVTFGTNLMANETFGQRLAQGLVVATAGGAVAALAGGSFELGFITAGVAFAANELVTSLSEPKKPQVAFVGGAADAKNQFVYNKYLSYIKSNPDGAIYFEHHQRQELAEWLVVNADNAIVIGHSWGANSAGHVIANLPEGVSVKRFVSVDGVGRNKPNFQSVADNTDYWQNVNSVSGEGFQWNDFVSGMGGDWGTRPNGIADQHLDVKGYDHVTICTQAGYCDP